MDNLKRVLWVLAFILFFLLLGGVLGGRVFGAAMPEIVSPAPSNNALIYVLGALLIIAFFVIGGLLRKLVKSWEENAELEKNIESLSKQLWESEDNITRLLA